MCVYRSEISNQLEGLLEETNKQNTVIKKALEEMKQENTAFAGKNRDSSEARIRENMHSALMRKFREILTEYQAVQTEFKQDVKAKVSRQVRIGTQQPMHSLSTSPTRGSTRVWPGWLIL